MSKYVKDNKCSACPNGSTCDGTKPTSHKICGVGEWTATAGTATTDTECQTCSKGRFRSTAPTSGKAEIGTEVCKVHKACAAGEWTEAEGTDKVDTRCKACSSGRYRARAPEGKSKEIETEV